MRWISRASRLSLTFFLLLTFASLLPSAETRKLSIYSPTVTYSLNVTEIGNTDYVGVFELLEPLSDVRLKVSGDTYKIRVNKIAGDFVEGHKEIRIGRSTIRLPDKIVVDHGRVMVPLHIVGQLISSYLGFNSDLHEAARRLFIGGSAYNFTTELNNAGDGLALHFAAAVDPTIATENNQVHMAFNHEPITFGSKHLHFDSKLIGDLAYSESNGAAEIIVRGTSSLLASFKDSGKTIVISAAPAAPSIAPAASNAEVVQTPLPTTPLPPPAHETGNKSSPTSSAAPRFFVMIDAGHGGADVGARFSDRLLEKDVTLSIARRLRGELQSRGIAATLLRDADVTLSADQRAVNTNAQRAGVYVSIHAGVPGVGVRVYTAMMPSQRILSDQKNGPFIPWDLAQQRFLKKSKTVADAVVTALGNKQIQSSSDVAPLAPLRSIAAPAFAVEVAPADVNAVDSLANSEYQETIASAIAEAIVSARSHIEATK